VILVTDNVPASSLTGIPHPIFARERWPGIDDQRFKAMEQSILLATKLLEIGMPYLACWLPKPAFATGRDLKTLKHIEALVEIRQDRMTDANIALARTELDEIAANLEWREDPNMLKLKVWWGITTYIYPKAEKTSEI
jgi:hypothetical protein